MFRDLLEEIAVNYDSARSEPLKGHPLALAIRTSWPSKARELIGTSLASELRVKASEGQGRWADAPWLAIFHSEITSGAMSGFYPVYLFEPGFRTVCLVMGQGAESLVRSMGKRALPELSRRAELLRQCGGDWRAAGFTDGPFQTLKSVSRSNPGDEKGDLWSLSAAFGKRYEIAALPNDEVLGEDLKAMLALYQAMVQLPTLRFAEWDASVEALKENGELPKGALEGVKRVIEHKRIEKRSRDRKLVKEVKARLGVSCQACGYALRTLYGTSMEDYIEVHHKVPLHTLPEGGAFLMPSEKDFIVLCSNCHKAIHKAGCPDIDDFRRQLNKVGGWPAA